MRCKPAGFAYLKVHCAARELVRRHEWWVLHALHCRRCDVRDEALRLLGLAGLTEEEFIQGIWDLLVAADDAGR